MARKPQSFKVEKAKKRIILYTNIEQSEAEKTIIKMFIDDFGYTVMFGEKKKGEQIKDMREALSKDENALAEFNKLYAEEKGFYKALAYYAEWKKNNKKEEK